MQFCWDLLDLPVGGLSSSGRLGVATGSWKRGTLPKSNCGHVMEGQNARAVSRHDSCHQQVNSQTNNWSFSRGAKYPIYWGFMLEGRFV